MPFRNINTRRGSRHKRVRPELCWDKKKNCGATTVRQPTALSNVHLAIGTNCDLVRQHPVLNQNVMTSS